MKQALFVAFISLMIGQPYPPPPPHSQFPPPGQPSQGQQPPRAEQPSTDGPWNRDINLLESSDGLSFTGQRLLVERAGVPNVVQWGDSLVAVFQWFPFDRREAFDRVGVIFSSDDGSTWTDPAPIVINGMPADYQRAFDPTLAVLPDGRIRIYFTSSIAGGFGGIQTTFILSAISEDGVNFQFEKGVRASSEASPHDCSVVFWRGEWHLFAHTRNQKGFHATSRDGLTFCPFPDMTPPPGTQFIGNALVLDSTTLRYYGARQGQGVWSATSRDGTFWKLDPGVRARGGDASVIRLKNGEYLMAVCGELRPDAGPPPFSPGGPGQAVR